MARATSKSQDILLALFAVLVLFSDIPAQDGEKGVAEEAAANQPIGKFLTLTSPVDDRILGRVQTAALALQNQAAQENRKAVLVLEITPGSSRFGHVQELARALTSADL
jgi:hypothetical protein